MAVNELNVFGVVVPIEPDSEHVSYQGAVEGQNVKQALDNLAAGGVNHWKGKKWYAYGTSLTDTENYPSQPYGWYAKALRDMSGMVMYNKGIAGGGLMRNNHQIRDAIMNITDGKTEADLITLECMINDHHLAFGTVDDLGMTTFLGTLANCIMYLQQNTTAQIVIIASTENSRDLAQNMFDDAPTDGSTSVQMLPTYRFPSDNRTWAERCELVRLLCEMYGVHFINPAFAIGYYRKPESGGNLYYSDTYHHTQLGGYVIAEYIWSRLKDIPLWRTALPT